MSETNDLACDMTLIDPQEYREALAQYLRKGTPIRFETKNARPATYYIWRTRRGGNPADIGVEVIDPGETIFENIHRPPDNYLRGRTGLPPHGPQRLGVQTGEPYSITDDWSGTLKGQNYLDPARSAYG